MNCSEDIFGSLECAETSSNEDWVEIHATWTITEFTKLLTNEKIKEIDSPILTATTTPGMEKIINERDCRIVKANKPLWIVNLNFKADGNDNCIVLGNDEYLMNKNGTLLLKFELKVLKDFKIPGIQLINDIESLFLEGMYTDIVMKSADNEEFKVHKAVLATRSPVLKAHFQHNTVETITNVVESPLESEVLHEVLSFIYTDEARKVDEIPAKLLAAADYYQLTGLKSLCVEALLENLTLDNAIETLQLAELYSAKTLELRVLRFIKKDKQNLITKTEGWAKLQTIDLLKKMYELCK